MEMNMNKNEICYISYMCENVLMKLNVLYNYCMLMKGYLTI